MPRKAIDYAKTIIYKLVCNDLDVKEIYVGQTTSFKDRKSCHASRCYNESGAKYNLRVYQFIRANGGWTNWSMVEIEKYPCKDTNEAHARERYFAEALHATLNSNVPGRGQKESQAAYRKVNKTEISKYQSEYREDHKVEISKAAAKRQSEPVVCACGVTHTRGNKAKHLRTANHARLLAQLQPS